MPSGSLLLPHSTRTSDPVARRGTRDAGRGRQLAGEFAYRAAVAFLRWRHGIRARRWREGDLTIAYDEAGCPSRPTLVCIPGFASSKDYFLRLTALLRRNYHVLVADLPGFGRSTASPDAVYSLAQYGRWLERFLDAVLPEGRNECHFLGNSLGGAVGLELALNRRHTLATLTLVAAGGVSLKGVPTIYDEIEAGRNPFAVRNLAEYLKFRRRVLRKKDRMPAFIQKYLASEFIRKRRWFGKILEDLKSGGHPAEGAAFDLGHRAYNERLREISCPVLVLWGEKDGFFPDAIGKLIAGSIPNARLEILPGVGHCPQLEAPEMVAGLVGDFLPVAAHPVRILAPGKL